MQPLSVSTALTRSVLGSLLGGSAIGKNDDPPELVVKITSSHASIPIVFTGAYAFFGGELELLDGTTPHVLQSKAHTFSGIFQQQSSGAVLEVRLFQKKGDREHEVGMGDGNVIIMSELGGKTWVSSW
jgi:hypothetical protein